MAWPQLAAALVLAGTAVAAPHHAHRAGSPDRHALDAARNAHAALLRRQANQAALIDARRKAQSQAQARATQDAARTRNFAAQTRAATAELSETETRISALQNDIAALSTQQEELRRDIRHNAAMLRPLLPLAERLSIAPSTSLIAAPIPPDRAVEGLSIIAGLSVLTERAAERLHQQQTTLALNDARLKAQNDELAALRQKQSAERDAAAQQTRLAARAEKRADDAVTQARAAVATATAQATNLQDAIAQIEKTEADAQARLDAEARALQQRHETAKARRVQAQANAMSTTSGPGPSRGNGTAPVAGRITVAWGQTTEAGPATGITYETPGGAAVHAPCGGRVDFAGPFRSFGQMLILDCGRRYRFVVAGLGTLAARSGQPIARGGALGTMPGGTGHLFLQLRQGSQSVDPQPFL